MAKSRSIDHTSPVIQQGLQALENDVILAKITDFFSLFPAIYALTSNPENVTLAAEAVLEDFLDSADGKPPQCTYLELRTTPRQTDAMTKREYLKAVMKAMEKYTPEQCNLIVSVDWRMSAEQAMETVELAIDLFKAGERIVGIDLCGDFQNAIPANTTPALERAREAGLPLTVHIAEASFNPQAETDALLALHPSRLGHATFLNSSSQEIVLARGAPIELCLSSNLLCKTVPSLDDHHIKYWIEKRHPVAICTDDTLPFRTSLLAEYALLLAKPPLGLGLSREQIAEMAADSLRSSFVSKLARN